MTPKQLQSYLERDGYAFEAIREVADEIREAHFGKQVYVRGLIEFSNYCRCSCKYCGLRRENTKLKRFRLEKQEIIDCLKEGYALGYRSFVLQSGEDPYYTEAYLVELVKAIKQVGDVAITLSIGERPYSTYQALKGSGVNRFLIKHECADVKLYDRMHPHSTFKKRLECLVNLKKLGYQTGSGFMIGLPEQTSGTIARDLWLLKRLGVHMAGIGPFIAHPDTPFANKLSGEADMTLKAVALARILMPQCMLPITTSLGIINPDMKAQCLGYGANVVMQKLEPAHLRTLYQLYPKEQIVPTTMQQEKQQLETWLTACNREPVFERGDHQAFTN